MVQKAMGPVKKRRPNNERTTSRKAREFAKLASDVFGTRYKVALTSTGYHYATIMRWLAGDLPIPPIMWKLLRILKGTPRHYWETIFVCPTKEEEKS